MRLVSSASGSLAVTVPTAVEFSATSKVAPLVKTGALLGAAAVLPVPESDHVPVPSSLVARTCTSYPALGSRPVMGVDVATPV